MLLGLNTHEYRTVSTTLDDTGRHVRSYSTVEPVRGTAQPARSEEELQRLPERQRTRGALKFYVPEGEPALSTAEEPSETPPDQVRVDGVWYEVATVDRYDHRLGGPAIRHTKYMLVRLDEQP